MKIKKYLNTNGEEVKSKKFNIFIGISLGNKYFTKENIKKYITWALENTRDNVLVLIADKNHAINYEVLNGYGPQRALQVALRKGEETEDSVKKIVRGLPKEKHHLIKICKWDDAKKSTYYQDKIKIILNEFSENTKFHDFIIKIVQENLNAKAEGLNLEQLEKLSLYVLDELPILLNGVEFEGKIYNLHPYPGLSCLDDLLMGLQNGTMFPKLAKMLEIENKIAEVEAYVD
jgi:tRNA-dependent cyclodipeptide synthase